MTHTHTHRYIRVGVSLYIEKWMDTYAIVEHSTVFTTTRNNKYILRFVVILKCSVHNYWKTLHINFLFFYLKLSKISLFELYNDRIIRGLDIFFCTPCYIKVQVLLSLGSSIRTLNIL